MTFDFHQNHACNTCFTNKIHEPPLLKLRFLLWYWAIYVLVLTQPNFHQYHDLNTQHGNWVIIFGRYYSSKWCLQKFSSSVGIHNTWEYWRNYQSLYTLFHLIPTNFWTGFLQITIYDLFRVLHILTSFDLNL